MDIIILSNLLKKSLPQKKKIEHMHEEEDYNLMSVSNVSMFSFLLMIMINSYAAYLSWDCNSSKNYPLILKVVFSLFAFMFGSIYIVYFILFKFDECNQFPKIQ